MKNGSILAIFIFLWAFILLIAGIQYDAHKTTYRPASETETRYTTKYSYQTTETKAETKTETYKSTAHIPTVGEQNALAKALVYLSMNWGYSEAGLKDQLEFEGYTSTEAQYGVDNCGADWYEQAEIRAAVYLKTMPFSKEGLIEQLESEAEGFTHAQAVHGASSVFD